MRHLLAGQVPGRGGTPWGCSSSRLTKKFPTSIPTPYVSGSSGGLSASEKEENMVSHDKLFSTSVA